MTADLPFQSPYRHGFVRVAVAAPRLHLAQPAANAEETVRLARIADERGAALVVFPELGLSGYTVDDLFHQQGLLGAVRDAVATLVAASAGHARGDDRRRSAPSRSEALQLRAWSSTAAASSASFPSPTCRTTASTTRSGSSPAPRWRSPPRSSSPASRFRSARRSSALAAGRRSRSTSRSARTSGSRCRRAPGERWRAPPSSATCRRATPRWARPTTAICCARRTRAAASPPISTPAPASASRPPTWPGTTRR